MAFGARNNRRVSFGLQLSAPAQAWLSRTTALSSLYRNAGIALINGLVSDGVWPKLDTLKVFASQDETNALLDLVSASFNGTAVGSPTFTAGGGYTTASGKYIDSNWNYSTNGINFTQNAASIFGWSGTSGQSGHFFIGSAAASSGTASITARSATDTCNVRCNDNTAVTSPANTDGSGFFVGVRKDSATKALYKDGVSFGDISRVSVAVQNVNLVSGGNFATAGNAWAGIIRVLGAGGLLTAADNVNFYARLQTYKNAVGITGN